MRDVRHKFPLVFAGLVQLAGHVVQRGSEIPHLIVRFNINFVGQVAGGILLCTVDDLFQRPVHDEGEKDQNHKPKYLDMKVIEQPAAAMVLVSKELNRLGELAESLLSDLKTAIVADGDSKTHGSFIENLEIVHQLQDSVTEYITRLFASGNLTEQQSEQTAGLLYVNNSIQRIADRCEDIDQICEKVNNNGKRLTSEASSEMEDCIDIIQQLLKKAMEAIRKGDAVVAETVFENKKKMHKAEKKYSKAHLNRVKNEVCDASMTRYFSGIMYNFDRMADNCVSIAEEACDNVAFINLDEETGKSMMERGAV